MFFWVEYLMEWLEDNPQVIISIFVVVMLVYLIIDMRARKKAIDSIEVNSNFNKIYEFERYVNSYNPDPKTIVSKYREVKYDYLSLLTGLKKWFNRDLFVWGYYMIFALASVGIVYFIFTENIITETAVGQKIVNFTKSFDYKILIYILLAVLVIYVIFKIIVKARSKKKTAIDIKSHSLLRIFCVGIIAIIVGIFINYILCTIPKDEMMRYFCLGIFGCNIIFMIKRKDPMFLLLWKIPTLSLVNKAETTTYDVYEADDIYGTNKKFKERREEVTSGHIYIIIGIIGGSFKLVILALYVGVTTFSTIALSFLYSVIYPILMIKPIINIRKITKGLAYYEKL